jgi:hypothetical protein
MQGAPPSVAGVPMLRFFWEPLIDLFGSIMATFFYGINDKTNSKKFYIAGHESSVILLEEYAPSLCGDRGPFLDVVLDIVLAIQRLLRSDMVSNVFLFPNVITEHPCPNIVNFEAGSFMLDRMGLCR